MFGNKNYDKFKSRMPTDKEIHFQGKENIFLPNEKIAS